MGYAPRTWGRLIVLLVMVVLIIFLSIRLRDPRGWAWLAASRQPAEEQVTPAGPKPPQERLSIDPDRDLLKGAADRQPFLVDNPHSLLPHDLERRDKDARYALLRNAEMSLEGSLFTDARHDVRYSDLLTRPNDYRGEVIYLRGDLLWIKPMELKHPEMGLKSCYQGLITAGHPDRAYWLLFTKLPPGMPDAKDWGTLYLPNVEFAGYFYKILSVEPAKGETEPRYLPVLVGQTLRVPVPKPPTDDLAYVLGVFLAAAVPVVLIGLFAWWWYRRSDRQLLEKMAQVRQRVASRDEAAVEQLGQDEGAPPEPQT